MDKSQVNLLLADDDSDDRMFFKDALDDLGAKVAFSSVNDGVDLMDFLTSDSSLLPDLLFLDINMPRKNGFECLAEIKTHAKLRELPVIIFSTSLDRKVADLLYEGGAQYFIRKPGDFAKLKKLIHEALSLTSRPNRTRPPREDFILY
jgi:CheY-like chemotaxis protein